jgi:hypothetical protein
MNIVEEQKPSEADSPVVQVITAQVPKKKIICKFWMMGTCIKDDKCPYLHTERDKSNFQNKPVRDTECNLYKLGFCKNGPLCNFKHIKEEKSEEDLENMTELPIWFIESIIGKQISLIYQDFEQQNPDEIAELKAKYMQTQPQQNRNKIKFNYTNSINNRFPNSQNKNLYKYDMYAEKKEQILESLNKMTRYFFIRNRSMDYVQFIMENNIIPTTKSNAIKINEAFKTCQEIVFIIFDEDSMNFNGFCRYKKDFDDNEMTVISEHYFSQYSKNLLDNFKIENPIEINRAYITIEWHWKTKLSAIKVELLRNPLSENEIFINSKDNQEISRDLGNYICRMMIKRLSKEEVKEYMDYKNFYEENSSKSHNKSADYIDRRSEKFENNEKIEGDKNSISNRLENFEKYPQSLQLMQNYESYSKPTIRQQSIQSIPGLQINTKAPYFQNLQNLQNIQPNIPLPSNIKNNLNFNDIIYEEIQKSTIKSGSSNIIPQFGKIHTLPITNSSDINNNSNIIVTNISNLQVNISQNPYQESNFRNDKTDRKKYYEKTRRERERSNSINKDVGLSLSRSRSRSRSFPKEEDSKHKNYYKRNYNHSRSSSLNSKLRYRSRSRGQPRSENLKNTREIENKRKSPSPTNRYEKHKYSEYRGSTYTTNSKSSGDRYDYSAGSRYYKDSYKSNKYYDSSDSNYLNRKRNYYFEENHHDNPRRNISFNKSNVNAYSNYSDSKSDNKVIKNKLFSNAMEKIATTYLNRDSRTNK